MLTAGTCEVRGVDSDTQRWHLDERLEHFSQGNLIRVGLILSCGIKMHCFELISLLKSVDALVLLWTHTHRFGFITLTRPPAPTHPRAHAYNRTVTRASKCTLSHSRVSS